MLYREFEEQVLSDREIELVKDVLSRYDLNIVKATKIRSIYKLYERNGECYCLKRTSSGKKTITNAFNFVQGLYNNGFEKTPQYIKDKKGRLFSKYHNHSFYVMDWVEGGESNLSILDEAIACSKLLAEFHNASEDIERSNLNLKNATKDWMNIFMEDIYALDRYSSIIESKRLKTAFDFEYKNYIEFFTNRALIALNMINTSAYNKVIETKGSMVICHNSYYYQNIIRNNDGFFIIDLNNLIYDLRISDLGKYIRRLMSKKAYRWDFEKCKILIEAYNSVYKLSKDEIKIMLAMIIFPHRFCKLGKKRYIKHKNWPESRYNSKLKRIVKQYKIKDAFINDYLAYINDYD